MQKCIDGRRHRYREKGGMAECVYCGFMRKSTKAQRARWDRIERQMGMRFSRALARAFENFNAQ